MDRGHGASRLARPWQRGPMRTTPQREAESRDQSHLQGDSTRPATKTKLTSRSDTRELEQETDPRESYSTSSQSELEEKPRRRKRREPRPETQREPDPEPHSRYRRIVTTDWRGEICQLLKTPPDISDEDLFKAIDVAAKALDEVDRLRSSAKMSQGPPRFQVIHSVRCASSRAENKLYLDQPWVVETGPYNAHLRGSQPINNFELYLERNKEVVFIVYRDYECCGKPPVASSELQIEGEVEIDASSLWEREQLVILLPDLKLGLEELATIALQGIPHPNFEMDNEIPHPFIWWFHRRTEIEEAIDELDPSVQPYVQLFRDYVLDRMSDDWGAVDELLKEDRISAQYLNYLFVPGTMMVSTKTSTAIHALQGFVAEDWLETEQLGLLWINGSSWSFDGKFRKTTELLAIHPLPSESEDFNITDMFVYPIKFATDEVVKALRKRGEMFWKCRSRNYVSYNPTGTDEMTSSIVSRFMVDIAIHKQMHPDTDPKPERARRAPYESDEEIGPELMSQDDPELGDEFFMCLPTSIPGFNMDKKEWVNLDVHYIEDVVWNTEAFDFLVIDPETKELVKAVVMNQLHVNENADLIKGKGNGLFILLHGGPGTGKTLTAESVAEIAKRPLYRVTCGDIGTKAEEVEEYLQIVLHLGKTWGCVVLLDEADVFLEQRSLVNLERNALVSVFLRVLEYYEGILILTSNRVGIFDEAFKSRIQLNLRYKNLSRDQRLQIWNNFIKRLKRLEKEKLESSNCNIGELDYGIKADEIQEKVEELSDINLNGRQIRNAISTARQLARYRKEPMAYRHFEVVINEAKKFDEYLLELNKWFTPDDLSRDRKER